MQRRNGGIRHRRFQAEQDPAPAVLGHLVHRLSPDSLIAARAIPTAEAIGGRLSDVGTIRVRPVESKTFVPAPEWVELNFRSFSLGGKGLERGHTALAGFHAPPRRLLKEYSGSRTGRLCAFRQGTTTRRSNATARRRDAGSTAQPPCHVTGLRPSSCEDRPARATPPRLAVCPQSI